MPKAQRITKADVASGGFKFCTWDIESTGLNANFGHVLCATVKPLGGRPKVFRIDECSSYQNRPWSDKELVQCLRDELANYNVDISYNGLRFDIPFVNSRLIKYRLAVLSPGLKHLDLIFAARYRMRLSYNSLENLLTFIESKAKKTPLDPDTWARAGCGDIKALDQIVKHNIADCAALEEAFNRLIPFLDIQFKLIR